MRPNRRAADTEPEPYGRAAPEPHEPMRMTCPYCGREVNYLRVPGRQRQTCGAKACLRKWRHAHGIGNGVAMFRRKAWA